MRGAYTRVARLQKQKWLSRWVCWRYEVRWLFSSTRKPRHGNEERYADHRYEPIEKEKQKMRCRFASPCCIAARTTAATCPSYLHLAYARREKTATWVPRKSLQARDTQSLGFDTGNNSFLSNTAVREWRSFRQAHRRIHRHQGDTYVWSTSARRFVVRIKYRARSYIRRSDLSKRLCLARSAEKPGEGRTAQRASVPCQPGLDWRMA